LCDAPFGRYGIERREHLCAKTAFRLLHYGVGLTKKQDIHRDVPVYRTVKHKCEFRLGAELTKRHLNRFEQFDIHSPVSVHGILQNAHDSNFVFVQENMQVAAAFRNGYVVLLDYAADCRSSSRLQAHPNAGVANDISLREQTRRQARGARLALGEIAADAAVSSVTRQPSIQATINATREDTFKCVDRPTQVPFYACIASLYPNGVSRLKVHPTLFIDGADSASRLFSMKSRLCSQSAITYRRLDDTIMIVNKTCKQRDVLRHQITKHPFLVMISVSKQ
jgi:hypothetical protein